MTPDQLADRIMRRIEEDKAVHKSSIIEELRLCLGDDERLIESDPLVAYLANRYGLSETWFKGGK